MDDDKIIFKWTRGDDEEENIEFTYENGEPLDFTGSSIDCDITPLGSGHDRVCLSTDDQSIIVNGNELHFIIAHEKTENAKWKMAVFDIQETKLDGKIKTWCEGEVYLKHDVTPRKRRV